MEIIPISPRHAEAWIAMREELWPSDPGEHEREVGKFFDGKSHEPVAVYLAFDHHGEAVGFLELSIRNIANDCTSGRVAYIEGLFVAERSRRRGLGTALIRKSEEWGREQGCTEIASDAEHDNLISILVHKAAGFQDVGTVTCFRKDL